MITCAQYCLVMHRQALLIHKPRAAISSQVHKDVYKCSVEKHLIRSRKTSSRSIQEFCVEDPAGAKALW